MSEMAATLETVGTLLGERARFEGWLQALEQKRATMPPHVVTRVRDDYGTRLGAVLRELGTHVPALAGAAEGLASRDATLRHDEDARHDARAEAELRHAVGEFDDATWERMRAEHDGDLETLAMVGRQGGGEVATVRELLAQAEDAQRIVDAGGPLAAGAAAPTRAAVPGVDAAAAPGDGEATADAAADAIAGTDAPADAPPPPPAMGAPEPGYGERPDLLRDAMERRTPAPGAESLPGAVATATPPAVPAAPTDPRKTLKCAECGTFNLPTEWYCESCGGELAVF